MKFDKIYIISLKNRIDRLHNFYSGLPNPWVLGDIENFNAVDGKNCKIPKMWRGGTGSYGCYSSHYTIIKNCLQDSNINNVLILEDDAIFCDNFNTLVGEFLSNLPNDWEMIYLGGQHIRKPKDTIINNSVGIGTNINRTHAYGVSRNGMIKLDKLLNLKNWKSPNYHIDHQYGRLHELELITPYCSLPWLIGQRESLSNIANKTYNTRWWN